jgi:deoxycytidylate deaminase
VYYENLSRRSQAFLNQAVTIATNSSCRYKHGAIIVRGGRVLSVGVNSTRNFCLNVTNPVIDSSYHAEWAAIKACVNPAGATIYIARANRKGEARESMPCDRCMRHIAEAGIKKIVYTRN